MQTDQLSVNYLAQFLLVEITKMSICILSRKSKKLSQLKVSNLKKPYYDRFLSSFVILTTRYNITSCLVLKALKATILFPATPVPQKTHGAIWQIKIEQMVVIWNFRKWMKRTVNICHTRLPGAVPQPFFKFVKFQVALFFFIFF